MEKNLHFKIILTFQRSFEYFWKIPKIFWKISQFLKISKKIWKICKFLQIFKIFEIFIKCGEIQKVLQFSKHFEIFQIF